MRVCPKCGFEENACWMGSHWRRYSDYCRIDALEVFEPEVVMVLKEKPNEWVFLKPNWYRFTPKNGIINRTNDGYGMDEWKGHGFTEKPKDNLQRRLLEEPAK